jgi:hypothetical protein
MADNKFLVLENTVWYAKIVALENCVLDGVALSPGFAFPSDS